MLTYILFLLIGFLLGRIKQTILYRGKKPYLIRTTLFSCPLFSIKIHKALMSDPGDLHDHPWNYLSIILWGGYYEETIATKSILLFVNNNPPIDLTKNRQIIKWYKPGSFLFRKGNIPHKLIIPEGKHSISLIFTTRKWRDWGFIKDGRWYKNKNNSY